MKLEDITKIVKEAFLKMAVTPEVVAPIEAALPIVDPKPADPKPAEIVPTELKVGDDIPDGEYTSKDGQKFTIVKGKIETIAPTVAEVLPLEAEKTGATKTTETVITEVKAAEVKPVVLNYSTEQFSEIKKAFELKLAEISASVSKAPLLQFPVEQKLEDKKPSTAKEKILRELEYKRNN